MSTLTGSDGRASITFTLGSAGGTQSVRALVDGNQSVTFTATGVTMELAPCGGDGQVGIPGQLAPIAPCVVLADGHGPVAGATVRWTVNGSGIPLPATSKTDATGRATTIFSFGPPLATPSILAITAGTAAPLSFMETSSFEPVTPGATEFTYVSSRTTRSGATRRRAGHTDRRQGDGRGAGAGHGAGGFMGRRVQPGARPTRVVDHRARRHRDYASSPLAQLPAPIECKGERHLRSRCGGDARRQLPSRRSLPRAL